LCQIHQVLCQILCQVLYQVLYQIAQLHQIYNIYIKNNLKTTIYIIMC